MMGHPGRLLGRLGLVLATGLMVVIIAVGHSASVPVYSVARVQAGLVDQPQAWLGRPVLVRGLAREVVGYTVLPGCRRPWTCTTIQRTWRLTDPGTPDPARGLPLAWGSPDQLRALLRPVPLLGCSIPRPQEADPGRAATYRIQLRMAPARSCATPTCYEAVLLDAAP
jgi:hypothetical protein